MTKKRKGSVKSTKSKKAAAKESAIDMTTTPSAVVDGQIIAD
jgi:hypothetical protein